MEQFDVISYLKATYGSFDPNRKTVSRYSFYDYIRYPTAGGTQLQFFSVPLGGQDPNSSLNKTEEQTNVPKARSLGKVDFLVKEIRCHAHILVKPRQHSDLSTDADLLYTTISNMMPKYTELLRRGVLNIKLGEKQYFDIEQPFQFAGANFGVKINQHAAMYVSGFTNFSLWVQQSPNSRPFALSPPQLIEADQTIDVTINYPSTSPAFTGLVNSQDPRIDVGVFLDGYVIRDAQ